VAGLLERGADPDAADVRGETPLLAALRGCGWRALSVRLVVLERLLDAGADPDRSDDAGDAPLTRAVGGDPALVRALLAAGADPEAPGARVRPLLQASQWGQADAVELLLERGAAADARDPDGRTALMLAVVTRSYGDAADARRIAVTHLLRAGAGLDARDERGRTPLHWAAMGGDPGLVEVLTRAGADRKATDAWERTPLAAATARARDAVESLPLTSSGLARDPERRETLERLLAPSVAASGGRS
jgi:ankyrin repeat protein